MCMLCVGPLLREISLEFYLKDTLNLHNIHGCVRTLDASRVLSVVSDFTWEAQHVQRVMSPRCEYYVLDASGIHLLSRLLTKGLNPKQYTRLYQNFRSPLRFFHVYLILPRRTTTSRASGHRCV